MDRAPERTGFWSGLERRQRGVCPGGDAHDDLLPQGEDVARHRVGECKGAGRKFDDGEGT